MCTSLSQEVPVLRSLSFAVLIPPGLRSVFSVWLGLFFVWFRISIANASNYKTQGSASGAITELPGNTLALVASVKRP